jgi:phage/plasmid-like protein (TIGR03299 family)
MAHELESVNGRIEMAYVGEVPWHGLGRDLSQINGGRITSDVMIREAGLDWQVDMRPLMDADANLAGKWVTEKNENDEEVRRFDGTCGTFRSDTNGYLGAVSDRYQIVQNSQAFDFLDSLMPDGVIQYETAGALRGGKSIWALAKMPGKEMTIAEGDVVTPYILFTTAHDGSGSVHALPTATRVVCANTQRIALGNHKGFRHIGDMEKKLDMVRALIVSTNAAFDAYNRKSQQLATRKFSSSDADTFMGRLFPQPVDADGKQITAGRGFNIWQKDVNAVKANLRNSRNDFPSIRGTFWALYNSVTELIDHGSYYKGGSDNAKRENRFLSLTDGAGADFKTEAYDAACEIAGVK